MTHTTNSAPSPLTSDNTYCDLFVQIYLRRQIGAAFSDYWDALALASVLSGIERRTQAPVSDLRLQYNDTGMNIRYGSHNLIINYGENRILVTEPEHESQS